MIKMKRRLTNLGLAKRFLFVLFLVALFAPILTNNKALLVIDNGVQFPFLNQQNNGISEGSFSIYPPIPYSASSIDYLNMQSVGPFSKQNISSSYYRHWLGTDELGRDVLAGLIYGCRTAIGIGLGSMLIALLIALIIGGSAGYFGDFQLKLTRTQLFISFLQILAFLYFIFILLPFRQVTAGFLDYIIPVLIYLFMVLILRMTSVRIKGSITSNTVLIAIPIDLILSRIIELVDSIPILFLLIALSAIVPPEPFYFTIILGISGWMSMAKYFRAEVLKLKNEDFVLNGKALGIPNSQLIIKHILPNAWGPVLMSFAFGIGAAISIESALSYLGLGLISDQPSWGSLIAASNGNLEAWWLAIFPGILLFLSIWSFIQIANAQRKRSYSGYSTRT